MSGIGILTRAVAVACLNGMDRWYVAAGIPDSLGGLSKLRSLGLSNNELTSECVGAGESVGRGHYMYSLAGP